MIQLPKQNIQAWKGCMTVLHTIAMMSTVGRLGLRYKKLWWDDYLSIPPTIAVLLLTIFLHDGKLEMYEDLFARKDFASFPPQNTWTGGFLFLTAVWGSRISLATGFLRIFPGWSRSRMMSIALASIFTCIYLGMTVFLALSCSNSQGGAKIGKDSRCLMINEKMSVGTLLAVLVDILGDALLVICPLYMLWNIRLPGDIEKKLILAMFSSSIVTFLVCIVVIVVFYSPIVPGFELDVVGIMMSQIESSIAVIVCNLLVVAGFFYRMWRAKRERTTNSALVYIHGSSSGGRKPHSQRVDITSSTGSVPLSKSKSTQIHKSVTIEVMGDSEDDSIALRRMEGMDKTTGEWASERTAVNEKSVA